MGVIQVKKGFFPDLVIFNDGIKLLVQDTAVQFQIVDKETGSTLYQIDNMGLLTRDGTNPAVILYDPASSGLTATTVQGAIDEIVAGFIKDTVALSGGTATVSNASVQTDSLIFLTAQDAGSGTPGDLYISARTPGVSFTISSTEGTDDRTVAWMIVN